MINDIWNVKFVNDRQDYQHYVILEYNVLQIIFLRAVYIFLLKTETPLATLVTRE